MKCGNEQARISTQEASKLKQAKARDHEATPTRYPARENTHARARRGLAPAALRMHAQGRRRRPGCQGPRPRPTATRALSATSGPSSKEDSKFTYGQKRTTGYSRKHRAIQNAQKLRKNPRTTGYQKPARRGKRREREGKRESAGGK